MSTDKYLSYHAFGGDVVVWLTNLADRDSFIGERLDGESLDEAVSAAEAWWPLCLVGPHDHLDLTACLEAAADPVLEEAMARLLGDALLPAELVSFADANSTRRPNLIISPAPGLAAIPWEVLQVPQTQHRLCELFSVRMAAPAVVLGAHRMTPSPDPTVATYVIDPTTRRGQVLTLDAYSQWQAHVGDHDWGPQRYVDREMLRGALGRARDGRLLFFGHCLPPHEDASATALLLSDSRAAEGSLEALTDGRPLAAHDILTATDKTNGAATWQFPPRVGLVACGSGLDNAYIEPMGLVAAVLERGADTVLASRWALPSDHVTNGATTQLGIAVDQALASSDPVGSWNDWRCEQLNRWRADASRSTSPALFAAVTAYSMPKGQPA